MAANNANMSVIEVKNLSKRYEYYRKQAGFAGSIKGLFKREKLYAEAVKGISFSIGEGELVGFLGPNGAGKTTTLKMLSGILYPTSGEARVLGHVPWERESAFQKQFSIVMGQKNQLWWDLPAADSFLLNKEIYKIPDAQYRQTLDELGALLDVTPLLEIPVRKLSLGERMKMELIGALLHRPRVLFLDEPTIGLDVVSQQKIREFFLQYNRRERTTIILTSHYMKDVERLCERVIIINHGMLVYDGRLADLFARYVDHQLLTVTFTAPVSKESFVRYGTLKEYAPQRAVLEVIKGKVKEAAGEVLTSFPVDEILIDEIELEEVIGKVFAGEETLLERGQLKMRSYK